MTNYVSLLLLAALRNSTHASITSKTSLDESTSTSIPSALTTATNNSLLSFSTRCNDPACQVSIGSVYVTYWVVASSNTACLTDTNYGNYGYTPTIGGDGSAAVTSLAKLGNDSITTVVGPDGFTYTSPSAYLIIPTVSAVDACGNTLGDVFTSLTFSFAPGELSTGGLRGPRTAPFNFADFPCPRLSELPNYYIYPPGGPYKPQIVPPSQLYDLNPAFKSCVLYPGTCYDPPYALTPASALSPFTSPSVKLGSPTPTPTPGPKPKSPSPTPTRNPVAEQPEISSSPIAVVAPATASKAATPVTPQSATHLTVDDKTVISTLGAFFTPQGSSPGDLAVTVSDATIPAVLSSGDDLRSGDNTISPNAGAFSVGSLDFSQGGTVVSSDAVTPFVFSNGGDLTIGDLTVFLNPTAFSIGSLVLSQAGPAITVSNTPFSLGSAGLVIGTTKTVPFDPALVFTIGTQEITAAPAGFYVDGKTLLPGQSGIVVDGGKVVASLSSDDDDLVLVEDGITTIVPLARTTTIGKGGVISTGTVQSDPALVFTIDTQRFTAAPTGFDVDGKTLLPGQPGITVDGGKVVASLQSGGDDIILVEDGSTTTIPLVPTTTIGLGGVIMSGFAPIEPPLSTSSVTASSTGPNGTEIYFEGQSSKRIDIHASIWFIPALITFWTGLASHFLG